MNVADFITRVRFDYNDLDSDRVEDVIIIDYLNEGITELYRLNPSKFVKSVVVKLAESDLQVPCCCDLLKSVDAITDGHGNKIAEIKEVDDSASMAFNKPQCKRKDSNSRSYSKVGGTDNQFTVKPPVAPDEDVYARLTCAVKPEPLKVDSVLSSEIVENYASLVDYVLYRLFGAETESITSQQRSATHYKLFTDGVLLKEKVRNAFIKTPSEKL